MLEIVLLITLVVLALLIVGLVLLQQGKGADMGASFGSGASQTLFGSQGSGNFLTKATWSLAFLFFAICIALAYIAREKAQQVDTFDFGLGEPVQQGRAPRLLPASDIPVVGDDDYIGVPDVSSDVPVPAEIPVTTEQE